MTDTTTGGLLIEAARLYTRTSRNGGTHLAGRMGGVRIVIFPRRDGDPGDHVQVLMLGQAPPPADTATPAPPPRRVGPTADAPPPRERGDRPIFDRTRAGRGTSRGGGNAPLAGGAR